MKKYLYIYLLIAIFFINSLGASEDFLKLPKIDRKPDPTSWANWGRGEIKALPKFDPNSDNPWQVDLRGYDLSKLDLTYRLADLSQAIFDDKTIWPPAGRMPKGFDRKQIMEVGKNPGLGARHLHKKGVTGQGVSIAIIDNPLLVDHQEYAERLRLYEEINVIGMKEAENGHGADAHMHGTAVVSIAAGKTLGVAPEADVYYVASWPFILGETDAITSFKTRAQAFNRILEINQHLPKSKKIRVISMSIGWNPSQDGYKEITEAAQKAKQAGILVMCSSTDDIHGFRFQGMGRSPLANPDDFNSYRQGAFWAKDFYNEKYNNSSLLVPMDSRTTASPTGKADYVFYPRGGWSWAIPYVTGMYALCCQVDPNITPDRFWALAMKTGTYINLQKQGREISFGPILNPSRLIDALTAKEFLDDAAVKAELKKYEKDDESVQTAAAYGKDFLAKIAQIDINNTATGDIIKLFGKPSYFTKTGKKVEDSNLPQTYMMSYDNEGFAVLIKNNQIKALLFERSGYLFAGRIQVGSSFDDVFEFLGPPKETVEGADLPKVSKMDVLYKNINGTKGWHHYKSSKYNITVTFMNNKVIELVINSTEPLKKADK